jgi:hypothetical protein
MCHWSITGSLPNPPFGHRFSTKATHFQQYNIDMAYFAPTVATETIKQFKLRLYGVLRAMTAKMEAATEMRITFKYPVGKCVEKFVRSGIALLSEVYMVSR